MKIKIDTDKVKLSTREVLLFAADCIAGGIFIFDKHRIYLQSIKKYFEWRSIDRGNFYKKLYDLKKAKYIKVYQKDKEKYIELTPKGKIKLATITLKDLEINTDIKWDRKWRIVIFDIPEDKKDRREYFRRKLESMGFYQFQKSVMVFPFECRKEIDVIAKNIFVEKYVKYIVADFFQDDQIFIKKFLKDGVLTQQDFEKL